MTLNWKVAVLLLLTTAGTIAASSAHHGTFVLSNGVIRVELNGIAPPGQRYPCITSLSVQGEVIVPPIAVGALFQMDVRSSQGDNYNPTQSGACAGDASELAAWEEKWSFLSPGDNGLLMGVIPRTFESSTGQCTNGIPTPFYFNWGVQLGDDVTFPKEAMLIEQSFQRTSASAPSVDSLGVEIPTVYYGCDFAQFAYYLPVDNPGAWAPMNHPNTGSNNMANWPVGDYFMLKGYGNMRCSGNATHSPQTVLCAATYTAFHNSTVGALNNGAGGCPANLVPSTLYEISDQGVYGRLAIFAVGNMGTVSTALIQTSQKLSRADWGNLF